MGMIGDIKGLLNLFAAKVPDKRTHAWVMSLASDEEKWVLAHEYFNKIRGRLLETSDPVLRSQYGFEEICCKSIWNQTDTDAPFDSDAPYFIAPFAIELARALSIPDSEVIKVIAPA